MLSTCAFDLLLPIYSWEISRMYNMPPECNRFLSTIGLFHF